MTREIAVRKPPLERRRSRNHSYTRRLGVERLEHRWVLTATVAGQVIHDLNANGAVDAGEPGMAGVYVYLDANDNGQLDTVGSWLEPDDYAPGQNLSSVLPGVTLSLVNKANNPVYTTPIGAVFDNKGFAPSGDLVFGYGETEFFYDTARLHMDFATPVSSVALDFAGSRLYATEFGKMEIFDAQGNPLGSVMTPGLVNGQWATLLATRAQQDIAYAVAYTDVADEGGATGRLDALRINAEGSERWTVTDTDGQYDLPHLRRGRIGSAK